MAGIQARNVIRKGKKVGHEFHRGNWHTCAVGFLASQTMNRCDADFQEVGSALGINGNDILRYNIMRSVERGFEDASSNGENIKYCSWLTNNKKELALLHRYFKVGRNIARQAGLPFYDD